MVIVMIVAGVLCLVAMVALFVWARRSEQDIDYDGLRAGSTQTDGQRHLNQIGIGLSSGPTTFGQ